MRAGIWTVGALALLGGCGKLLPSDQQLDAAAKSFEERESLRIRQKTVQAHDDDGFSPDDEVEFEGDEKDKTQD